MLLAMTLLLHAADRSEREVTTQLLKLWSTYCVSVQVSQMKNIKKTSTDLAQTDVVQLCHRKCSSSMLMCCAYGC
jgi:hypothetical protein